MNQGKKEKNKKQKPLSINKPIEHVDTPDDFSSYISRIQESNVNKKTHTNTPRKGKPVPENSFSTLEEDVNIRWKNIRQRLKESLQESDTLSEDLFFTESLYNNDTVNLESEVKVPVKEKSPEPKKASPKSEKTQPSASKTFEEPKKNKTIIQREIVYENQESDKSIDEDIIDLDQVEIIEDDRFEKKTKNKKKTAKKKRAKKKEEPIEDINKTYVAADEDNLVPLETVNRRSPKVIFLGALIFIFAAVGIGFTIYTGVMYGTSFFSNEQEKKEISKYLTSVVLIDPPPFEDVSKLEDTTVIAAAVWDLILNSDVNKYKFSDAIASIPVTDVEVHITKLFGDGVEVEHQNIIAGLGDGYKFIYNQDTNAYEVDKSIQYVSYSPQVTNIEKEENTYTLKVAYMQEGISWSLLFKSEEELSTPTKYMTYILESESNGNYKIKSIQTDNTVNMSASSYRADDSSVETQTNH